MKKDIKKIINLTLQKTGLYTPEAAKLVFLTGLVETGYKKIFQYGTGPARSFWQVEPKTATDNYNNYIAYRDALKLKIKATTGLIIHPDILTHHESEWYLTTNLAFAIINCRIVYYRKKSKIPTTLHAMAEYWKKHYNTYQGKGTIDKFLAATKSI